jgi:hypothetical protein
MIYTIEKANLISEQLRRFTHGYAHHIAGQFENIDFWLTEVKVAMDTIDSYTKRFNKIRNGQKAWVDKHGTIEYDYCEICRGRCEFDNDGTPSLPKRTSYHELKTTRKELVDNTYHLLIRFYKIGLLDQAELESKCSIIGTSVEPSDL